MFLSEQMISNMQDMGFDPSKPCSFSEEQIDVMLKAGPPSKNASRINGRVVSLREARVYYVTQCFPAANLDEDENEDEDDDSDENNNIAIIDDVEDDVSDAYRTEMSTDSLVVPPHYFYGEDEDDARESEFDSIDMDTFLDDDWDVEAMVSDIEWESEASPDIPAPPASSVQVHADSGQQEGPARNHLAHTLEPEASSGQREGVTSNSSLAIFEPEAASGEEEVATYTCEAELASGEPEATSGNCLEANGDRAAAHGRLAMAHAGNGDNTAVNEDDGDNAVANEDGGDNAVANEDDGDNAVANEEDDSAVADDSPEKTDSQQGPSTCTPSPRRTRFRRYQGDARDGGPPRARKSLF